MKKLMILIALILLFASSIPRAYAGKEQRPLAIEDALAMLSFQQTTPIDLSPDGEWVAYTLQDFRKAATVKDERYRVFTPTGTPVLMAGCDIWITNTKSGEARNLTEGKGSSWGAVWSPNGRYLAFYSDRSGQAHLWVWEKSSRALRQLSDAVVRSIGAYQVPRWTPDGRKILTKVLPADMTIEAAAELIFGRPGETAVRRDNSQPKVSVYRSSAVSKQSGSLESEAWTNASLADLALVDASSGNLERIARGLKPHGYWISPDGSHVAFTHFKGFGAVNASQFIYDLSVVSLTEKRLQVVASNIGLSYFGLSVSWSPDGKALSYTTSGPQARGDCFIVAIGEGVPRRATDLPHPNFSDPIRPPLWDASGESLFFLSADTLWRISLREKTLAPVVRIPGKKLAEVVSPAGTARLHSPDGGIYLSTRDEATKQVGFYKVDLETGKYARLFDEDKSYGRTPAFYLDVAEDGQRIVYLAQDARHCPDLWIAGVDFRDRRQLTRSNPQFDGYEMGRSQLVEWRSTDGERLHGALLLPAGYEEGKKYPLIVNVYGGSFLSDDVNLFGLLGSGAENMQIFATRGYAVLMPDTPLHVGTPMQDLVKSVLPGVDKVVELGIADPDRLGVMGHSYGGYSTLALIVQTTRFKAAISKAGIGNLIGAYGQMLNDGTGFANKSSEGGQLRMGGTPWEFRDRYIENSPVFYLDRVRTPLLLIHGTLDFNVAPFLADEIFVGLQRLGKEVEYAKYEGEDHSPSLWGYANHLDYWHRTLSWFDRYLKTAPGVAPAR